MKFEAKRATRHQARLRMALHGASGAGKTYSALSIGAALGGRIALVDTERGSACKYAGDGDSGFVFDVVEINDDFSPDQVPGVIEYLDGEGYDIIVIDSLSAFWNNTNGLLEQVDIEVKRMKAKGQKPDSFAAWKTVDPMYRHMVQSLLACKAHLIVTMRAKMSYEKEQGDNGKTTIRKVGMAPEMRDAFTFEVDVEGMMDTEHNLVIGKTRCAALDGQVFTKPGANVAKILKAWLTDGAPMPERPPSVADGLVHQARAALNADALDLVKKSARELWGQMPEVDRGRVTAAIKDASNSLGNGQQEAAQ